MYRMDVVFTCAGGAEQPEMIPTFHIACGNPGDTSFPAGPDEKPEGQIAEIFSVSALKGIAFDQPGEKQFSGVPVVECFRIDLADQSGDLPQKVPGFRFVPAECGDTFQRHLRRVDRNFAGR